MGLLARYGVNLKATIPTTTTLNTASQTTLRFIPLTLYHRFSAQATFRKVAALGSLRSVSREYVREELPLAVRWLVWPRRRVTLASMRFGVLLGFGVATDTGVTV